MGWILDLFTLIRSTYAIATDMGIALPFLILSPMRALPGLALNKKKARHSCGGHPFRQQDLKENTIHNDGKAPHHARKT